VKSYPPIRQKSRRALIASCHSLKRIIQDTTFAIFRISITDVLVQRP